MIIYDYFSTVFCIAPKKVLSLKYRKWVSHLKNRYHYPKVVENATINFSISSYCTLLFSRKENFAIRKESCSWQWYSWLHYECMRISALKYWQYELDIYLLFENSHKSTQIRCKGCSNLTKCTTAIDFRITSVFFINLEHLSNSTLVLLLIL